MSTRSNNQPIRCPWREQRNLKLPLHLPPAAHQLVGWYHGLERTAAGSCTLLMGSRLTLVQHCWRREEWLRLPDTVKSDVQPSWSPPASRMMQSIELLFVRACESVLQCNGSCAFPAPLRRCYIHMAQRLGKGVPRGTF